MFLQYNHRAAESNGRLGKEVAKAGWEGGSRIQERNEENAKTKVRFQVTAV